MKLKNSFLNRISRLCESFDELKIEGFYTSNLIDIYYLTGLKLSRGQLFIHKKNAVLFVDGRYLDIAKKTCPIPILPLLEPHLLELFEEIPWKEVRIFGFDAAYCSYHEFQTLKKHLQKVRKKRRLASPFQLIALEYPVKKIRGIKEPREIRLIQNSAHLLWQGFKYIKKQLKTGVRECDVALQFEIYCRKKGAECLSFKPIVAFGTNTAFPHYQTGERKLKKGEVVLLDIGVYLKGYASDMTRIIFHGDVGPQLRRLYQVVKEAHRAALKKCHPGAKVGSIDLAARNAMKNAGLENHFLHSLGHGIGLEVHEYPSFMRVEHETVLKPGMVLTIEPGLYLPGKGGIRYEDMIVMTKNGHQNLFKETRP